MGLRKAYFGVLVTLFSCSLIALGQNYTVTLIPEPPEGGMVTGEGTYASGASVTVSAEALPGFEFAGWWEEGIEVSTKPTYTFTITSDRVLIAKFVPVFFFEGIKVRWKTNLELIPLTQLIASYADVACGFRFGRQEWQVGIEPGFSEESFTSFSGYFHLKLPGHRLTGRVNFDPRGPHYRSSHLSLLLHGGTLSFFGSVRHTPGKLLYSLNLRKEEMFFHVTFTDTSPEALQFESATLRLKYAFCCDLPVSVTLSFTKNGFQYLEAKVRDVILLCCDISADLALKVTPDEKAISLEPRWKYVRACLRLYGDVAFSNGVLGGLEIYGFRLTCGPQEEKEYPKFELLTAFSPEKLPWAGFEEGEFEYWALEFRSKGCCGGTYVFKPRLYFSSAGSIFGVSRVLLHGEFPLFESLRILVDLGFTLVPKITKFEVGWDASF